MSDSGPYICEECGQEFEKQSHRAGHGNAHRERPTFQERFWAKVAKGAPGECWLWTAATKETGYGVIHEPTRQGRVRRAHRVSWEFANGPIPEGALVLHDCGTKGCVNPDHLHLGDHSQNLREAWERGEQQITEHQESFGRRTRTLNAALTPDEVREIRDRYSGDETQRDLAEAFDVSPATINRLLNGGAYNWVH